MVEGIMAKPHMGHKRDRRGIIFLNFYSTFSLLFYQLGKVNRIFCCRYYVYASRFSL